MRVFLEIAYNGASFQGWQIQPNGPSVQQKIEEALTLIYRTPMSIVGAGRTDTGVNALGAVAHVDLPCEQPDLRRLQHSLNGILRREVVIKKIQPVLPKAHARFDAVWRTYHYYIARQNSPFWGAWTLQMNPFPNMVAMNQAAQYLLGEKDFTSFSKLHTDTKTNICNVIHAEWVPIYDGSILKFEITANRFLRNMVRAVVGTLIEVGTGKRTPESIPALLQKKDRSASGPSVPGEALFLAHVEYPPHLFMDTVPK